VVLVAGDGSAEVSQPREEPFRAFLPGRNYEGVNYRFGFNTMEKDDEMHGATGTSYDFGSRIHDARVARFLSIDPCAPNSRVRALTSSLG
jgi:hypothetical protein